jgi:leucyl aminopeptidase
MTDFANITIAKPGRKVAGTAVVLCTKDLALGPRARSIGASGGLARAAKSVEFTGKLGSRIDLLAPDDGPVDRLLVVSVGESSAIDEKDWLRLGGAVMGALGGAKAATVVFERPDGRRFSTRAAAQFALGMKLRAYRFDDFKTGAGEEKTSKRRPAKITIECADSTKVRQAWKSAQAIGAGVLLARDLVNLPPNVLGPVEFAAQAKKLSALGVKVEILTEVQMKKLGMRALLGVAQGSPRPPRIAVMRWEGAAKGVQPVAFVGKGVVFDSGGISLKPGGGMQDMKGDMAGAAAVVGLMKALAGRKAKVNAVGVIGLVENMPDGLAQRPGDIVTAMTGRTIEIINTDAEGRLVLADAIAYTENRFKPQFIIDLATLTGAVIVALGHHHAGMFANDDGLASALSSAGEETAEAVWRLPLGEAYDKQINSKFANVKNAGSRDAGAITAAQFLQRFVKDTKWVHLDIAGTAMGSPQTETNRSWASGFGVRLLDRLVADNYEA